jgi:hypothetical protein
MKPKTKAEIECMAISDSLPDIISVDMETAKDYIDEPYSYSYRNKRVCSDCHSVLSSMVCPKCGLTKDIANKSSRWAYVSVLEHHGNWQVIRTIYATKHIDHNKGNHVFASEVIRHYVNVNNGKIVSVAKAKSNFMSYQWSWALFSKFEVRNPSKYGYYPYTDIEVDEVIRYGVHPILKRNGFNKSFHGIVKPHIYFSMLIKDNRFETLVKLKQYPLMKHYYKSNGSYSDTYWQPFLYANKRGYKISDASMWIDYIKLLKLLGKLNPELYMPLDVKAAHNKALIKYNRRKAKQRKFELKTEIANNNIVYQQVYSPFFDVELKTPANIIIRPLHSVSEFYDHAAIFEHCLFTNEYYAKHESLILAAFKDGQPIENIELSLETLDIVHSGGHDNNPSEYSDSIKSTIINNINVFQSIIHSQK